MDPDWTKTFVLNHRFGMKLCVKVAIFNFIGREKSLEKIEVTYPPKRSKFRFVGFEKFDINDILGSPTRCVVKTFSGDNSGSIFVNIEKMKQIKERKYLKFRLRGFGLVNTREGKSLTTRYSNPYVEISKKIDVPSGAVW